MKKKLLVVLLLGVISISLTGCLPWLFPELNNPPVISLIPDTTVTVGETFTYTVAASDPDGVDSLIFSLTTNPSTGMDINPTTGAINWTPTTTGSFEVTVEVSDGKLSDTESFTLTVSPAPTGPSNIDLTPLTATVGVEYTGIATAIPGDNTTLTFSLAGAPSGMEISTAGIITWTPTVAEDQAVTVNVTDGAGLSDSEGFTIVVSSANKALLVSIEVLPSSITLEIGESRIIDSVTAHYSDNTEAIITPFSACTYESNKSNATVNPDGVITGVSSCTASTPVTITVTYIENNITQTDTVSVVVTNPSPT